MFIIYILTLIPVAIWSFMEPLSLRFADLGTSATSIGQVLGLVGMTLFSINLILAARFKVLDKYFKGLDKVYQNHHKLGAISFSLLLFHPLFLVVNYLFDSLKTAALFFVPFMNIPNTWGMIALALMILLLYITFYTKIKYNNWKISHKFLTLAFVFAVIHTLVVRSDISRSPLLRYYILSFAFISLIAVSIKVFLEQTKLNRYKYAVKRVNELNDDILEVEMEPVGKKMIYNPGQFAFFNFFSKDVSSESHPFSLSSSGMNDILRITAKNLGDYTSSLKNLKVGDGIRVEGPFGNFSHKNFESKNQIWIAGGIGITPFLGMAKTLGNTYSVDLYYSVKDEKEAVYTNSLRELAIQNEKFRFNLWISKDKGYITGEVMSEMSGGLKDKEIFLCGPSIFMESLKKQFVSLGVDINKIHYENFDL